MVFRSKWVVDFDRFAGRKKTPINIDYVGSTANQIVVFEFLLELIIGGIPMDFTAGFDYYVFISDACWLESKGFSSRWKTIAKLPISIIAFSSGFQWRPLNDPLKRKLNAFRSTAELFPLLIYWMWKVSTSEMQISSEFTGSSLTFAQWLVRYALNVIVSTFHLSDDEYYSIA